MLIIRIINKIKREYKEWRWRKTFKEFGKNSKLCRPLRIQGPKNISIGKGVKINDQTWLAAWPLTNKEYAKLIIEDNATLGDFNHIWATHKIVIGKRVLTANHVYISDNLHDYKDVNKAIVCQPIVQLSDVKIGDGAWIGENVCIIGASVGKNSVIGANSVVTHDIPDYSVAVGSPAKVIKRYDFDLKKWRKTDSNGFFIDEH